MENHLFKTTKKKVVSDKERDNRNAIVSSVSGLSFCGIFLLINFSFLSVECLFRCKEMKVRQGFGK